MPYTNTCNTSRSYPALWHCYQCLGLWGLTLLLYSCLGTGGTSSAIRLKGSDTEVNLMVHLAEAYHTMHPQTLVSISGGGSGLGIAALMNGTADIATSSRRMTLLEHHLFHDRGVRIDSLIFAQDAIAFVVNAQIPLNKLTLAQLSKLLDGTWGDWAVLTGQSLPVNIYGRQSNSGTYEFIRKRLGISYSHHAKEMNGNAQILEAVKQDPSGIGYVGAGYVMHRKLVGIKVLGIISPKYSAAISPLDTVAVSAGKYYFTRPLYQYFSTQKRQSIQDFLAFERSALGKKIIQASGYYLPSP